MAGLAKIIDVHHILSCLTGQVRRWDLDKSSPTGRSKARFRIWTSMTSRPASSPTLTRQTTRRGKRARREASPGMRNETLADVFSFATISVQPGLHLRAGRAAAPVAICDTVQTGCRDRLSIDGRRTRSDASREPLARPRCAESGSERTQAEMSCSSIYEIALSTDQSGCFLSRSHRRTWP